LIRLCDGGDSGSGGADGGGVSELLQLNVRTRYSLT